MLVNEEVGGFEAKGDEWLCHGCPTPLFRAAAL
jgi:hypothetical protein